jgi:hypothetical protein
MSRSPEQTERADDRLVLVISAWLAGQVTTGELRRELETTRRAELAPDQADARDELQAELDGDLRPAELQMVARETLETLALGR